MKREPTRLPYTSLDQLWSEARQFLKQSLTSKPPTTKKRLRAVKKDAPAPIVTYFVLVQTDRLCYRFGRLTGEAEPCIVPIVPVEKVDPRTKAAGPVFVRAFNEVWKRLPGSDRHGLLHYWRDHGEFAHPGSTQVSLHPRPLIQIADVGMWSESYLVCSRSGHVLSFPVDLIAEHEDQLAFEIAKALAQVYRYATGDHWRLVTSLIEDPFAQWEKRHRRAADKKSGTEKLASLEREFLLQHKSVMTELLSRWGYRDDPIREVSKG